MLNLVDDVYIEEAMPQNPRSLTDVNIRNKKRLRSRVRLILPIAAIIVMLTAGYTVLSNQQVHLHELQWLFLAAS